jgi:integrase
MKIRKVTNHGKPRWRVAWVENSRETRRFFDSKAVAESYARQIADQRDTLGHVWIAADADQRTQMVEAWRRAQAGGYTLAQACDAAEASLVKGKARTLGELVTAFLKAKEAQGLRPRSLKGLAQSVRTFARGREAVSIDTVTPDDIAAHILRDEWSARTRHGVLVDLGTLFGWAVRMEWLGRNPVAKVPKPILEPVAPRVLTVAECRQLLGTAEQFDAELVGFIALAMFAGLRPESELGRLRIEDIGVEHVTVGTGAKTRRRRLVRLSGNLLAFLARWRALSGELVPVNSKRRFEAVRRLAGFEHWPQDALRHSFVSYHYALHGESDTAAQAGHSAQMLHEHYRGLVTRAEAEAFFSIQPRPEPYGLRQTNRPALTRERALEMLAKRWPCAEC